MSDSSIYRDIAGRTKGSIYIGVVGPVRSGKSTFIKNFMEKLVIPAIEDPFLKERTRDELPQCGSGRSIMTAEPKFVPEEAVSIELEKDIRCAVRLVDCVGYMVQGAAGNIEDGTERMVMTPWYEHALPMSRAAEEGTKRVINEHSGIAVVVTTDGSVCGIPREDYIQPESRTIEELKKAAKPFVIILNCAQPQLEESLSLARELSKKYSCHCIPLNCLELNEDDIKSVFRLILQDFSIEKYRIYLPQWLEALDEKNPLKQKLFNAVLDACSSAQKLGECETIVNKLSEDEDILSASICELEAECGCVGFKVSMPGKLYYDTLSEQSGYMIKNDRDLMAILCSMSTLKGEYERIHRAMEEVKETGYGIIMPGSEEMKLEEPQVVKQAGRYSVKLKASAPSIHLIKTNIETEVSPAIGGERASEDMINLLIQGFNGDMSRIWESNIFGKSLNDIAGEGLVGKIKALPPETKSKLRGTIERIINEGSKGLICIIL